MPFVEHDLIPFAPERLLGEKLLVLAPHPDDEVIGCGGLVWHLAERGVPTSTVFLTRETHRSIATPSMVAGIPRRVQEARRLLVPRRIAGERSQQPRQAPDQCRRRTGKRRLR